MASDVSLTIEDGALGLAPEETDGVHVKMGYCTGGTPGVLSFYTDPKTLVQALQGGPAVEAAAFALQNGASPVGVLPLAASTSGTRSTVAATRAQAGEDASTGTLTPSGTPNDAYDVLVRIVREGATGTATFLLSLDGGDTYGRETATAGSFVVAGTGLTLAFSGSFDAGDVFHFTCSAPAFTSSDLGDGFDALLADSAEWGFVHVVGTAGNLSAQMAIASAVDAVMGEAEASHRFAFAVLELPEDTDTNLRAAMTSFVSERVVLCADVAEINSPVRKTVDQRSSAWPFTARVAKNRISRDPAAFADKGLKGVVRIGRDEFKTPGLDDARLVTLRTYQGQPGFYVTSAKTAASTTSDFQYLVYRRLMDLGCKVARNGLLEYLNVELRVNAKNGRILEVDARMVDTKIEGLLKVALVDEGHASAVRFRTNRTDNILSLQKLRGDIRIAGLSYARGVEATIGLFNPALAVVS